MPCYGGHLPVFLHFQSKGLQMPCEINGDELIVTIDKRFIYYLSELLYQAAELIASETLD